ncbi:MAG TPA: phosphoesterase [Clostridiales bacterium UBA8960]|jgi:predicted MPP superfamily phosphohydrolase|nr:phosphoesterase [Clostridiales bacterium UBA8960]
MNRNKRVFLWIVGLVMVALLFFCFQNNAIGITEHEIALKRLPVSFDGYKILQISDLHNKWFGVSQKRLMAKIDKIEFDIIVITGDIGDARRYDDEPIHSLIEQLVPLAPVYYVTGNHESDIDGYDALEAYMTSQGVRVLRNEYEILKKDGAEIIIAGIDDPTMHTGTGFESALLKLSLNETYFKILLSHRPEKMALYSTLNYDLVFSGHAHGGQIRMPFIGGVIAPHQGFFPKYFEGVHVEGETYMVISRGLGNSLFPLRVFNRPELVVVTLNSTD